MAGQVERVRTVTISVGVERLDARQGANLTGSVDYAAGGVRADLTGTVNSRPAHVAIADRRLYVP
jgi:hypothetical protein